MGLEPAGRCRKSSQEGGASLCMQCDGGNRKARSGFKLLTLVFSVTDVSVDDVMVFFLQPQSPPA